MGASGGNWSDWITVQSRLNPGDHACFLSEFPEEEPPIVTPFLQYGLRRKERCICVGGATARDRFLTALAEAGTDIHTAVEAGALLCLDPPGHSSKKGMDSNRFFASLDGFAKEAEIEGCSGMRIVCDAAGIFDGNENAYKVIEFEAYMSHWLQQHHSCGLCVYDKEHFADETLVHVVRIHPLIVHNGTVARNLGSSFPASDSAPRTPTDELNALLKAIDCPPSDISSLEDERREIAEQLKRRDVEIRLLREELNAEISKRSRFESALEQKTDETSLVLNSISDLVLFQDCKFKVLWANEAAGRAAGCRTADLAGRYCYEIWAGTGTPCPGCPVNECLETGKPAHNEITTPDGRVWSIQGYPVRDDTGKIQGAAEIVRNVTNQKRAEEANNRRAEMETLVAGISAEITETSSDAVDEGIHRALREIGQHLDVDHCLVFLQNESGIGLQLTHEWTASGLPGGSGTREMLGVDELPWLLEKLNRFELVPVSLISELSTEASAEHDYFEERRVRSFVSVPLLCWGSFVGFLQVECINRERAWTDDAIAMLRITSEILGNALGKKRTEEELRFLSSIVQQTHEGIATSDLDGYLLFVNNAFAEMLGYAPEELIGRHLTMFHSPQDIPMVDSALRRLRETGEFVGEITHMRRDGSVFPSWMNTSLLYDEAGNAIGMIAILRDISVQKEAEQALRISEERYRSFVDSFRGIAFRGTLDFQPIFMHGAVEAITGYHENDFVSGTLRWDQIVYSEDKDRLMASTEAFCSIPGHSAVREYRILRKDGSIAWIHEVIQNVCDTDGSPELVQGVIHEITQWKQLEESLRYSRRMEAIGRLAGGVAREFNNLLTGIMGGLSLAEAELTPKARTYLRIAQNAADRACSLVRQLLAFNRESPLELRPLALNRVVEAVSRLVKETIDRRIDVVVRLDEQLPLVQADEFQMESVFMNLCVNARDAIQGILHKQRRPQLRDKKFVIRIETRTRFVVPEYGESHSEAGAGKHVVVSVSDNGPGMNKETQQHVFEPFYTTKSTGVGVGLGLASAYGIVKQHNGWINLQSRPREGTTFEVYLPAHEETPMDQSVEDKREIPKGKETILLADDEDIILDVGQAILEKSGYTVLTALDGEQAVKAFSTHKDEIQLVILDLSMPLLSGQEVLERIREIDSHVKVLVSSGYSESSEREELDALGATGYVPKPYTPTNLAQKVRDTLDE